MMVVVSEAMKAKIQPEPKIDGRKTRTWTKAQRKAIAKRLAEGKAKKAVSKK